MDGSWEFDFSSGHWIWDRKFGRDTVPETRQDLETCHVIGRDVGSSCSVGANDCSGDFARPNTDFVFMVGTVEAGGWRRFVA